jgi:hypothetical protein
MATNIISKVLGGIAYRAKNCFIRPHYARAISVIRLAGTAGCVHHDR